MIKGNFDLGKSFIQSVRKIYPYRHLIRASDISPVDKILSFLKDPVSAGTKREDFSQISPVTKRPKRPKLPSIAAGRLPGHWTVTAYATAEEFDLENLLVALKKQDLYTPCELTSDEVLVSGLGNALHAVAKFKVSSENRHIYYFQEGTVVIWNCSAIEQHTIVNFLEPHEITDYERAVVYSEMEEMSYRYDPSKSKTVIDDGIMSIGTKNRTAEEIASDRFTLSNALALSVKLGVLETLLMQYIQTIEPVTQELRLGRPISISKSGVLRKSGELFALRHTVSLSVDFLDTPDFYWDRENLEGLYQSSCSYFSITRRTKVLNEKLNHCLELITLVSSHLSDRHHIRLEWMIIILIMVEVAFEILHFLKGR